MELMPSLIFIGLMIMVGSIAVMTGLMEIAKAIRGKDDE